MREIKFRAWNGEKYIYSFTPKGVDRLGWFFSNTRAMPRGEWTGLLDKAGVEIYEGDVVHYSMSIAHGPREEGNGEVFWYDKTGAFLIDRSGLWSIVELTFCEIIGDVYRNPDLCPEKAT